MKKRLFVSITSVIWMALAGQVQSEVVRVPVGEQDGSALIAKPTKGLNSDRVVAQFGSPISRHGPIGSPEIYYWEYEQFTVYFEGDHVIHAVSKIKSKTPVRK